MTERQILVANAILAEQAERYEDMAVFMKKVTMMEESLNSEERNLLSVAYKNKVGAKRSALRIVRSMQEKAETDGNEIKIRATQLYKDDIAEELESVCQEFLALVENHFIPTAIEEEVKVFAHKLLGDYYRYLVEVYQARLATDDVTTVVKKAAETYTKALDIAKEKLPSTNPIRLGLVLNFSVFHYEISENTQKACALAKEAFDQAMAELDSIKEDCYKDSTLVMQLLRDNLTLWTSETQDDTN